MIGFIYKYTNEKGCSYIGQTIHLKRRKKTHTRNGRFLNCNYQVIDSATDKQSLNFLEKHYIQLHKSHVSFGGYNLTLGGNGGKTKGMTGKKHTSKTKSKMSMSSLQTRPWSIESGRHMGKLNIGKKTGSRPERNQKIKEALLGKPKLKVTCRCGYRCDAANMKRWHSPKCERQQNGNKN